MTTGNDGGRRAPRWVWSLAIVAVAAAVYAMRPAAQDGAGAKSVVMEAEPSLPRLVDLGADKCIPCKMMAPILTELDSTLAGRLDVEFIDVWKNPDAGRDYGIKLIPTQIFFAADGSELYRHEGFFAKDEILAKWRELGVEL